MVPRKSAQKNPLWWTELSDAELLKVPMCELNLSLDKTPILGRLERVQQELKEKSLKFKPHYWLSDEWFCPDGIPGIAIPFYLAHPRLERLERAQMYEVEGGDEAWCLKILRHEIGHAIENAYRLRLRKKRRKVFGSTSVPYPKYYSPRPYSKRFVLHLDSWYAQSHPDEDFAETFAVWLTPNSDWSARYEGWPALKKLRYVNEVMQELQGVAPLVKTRKTVDMLSTLTKTLGEHYEARRSNYASEHPSFYDKDLRMLFSEAPEYRKNKLAKQFIQQKKKHLRTVVSRWTGSYQYMIKRVIDAMTTRCEDLELRLVHPEEYTLEQFVVLLTVQTMNYLHSGRHRVAL